MADFKLEKLNKMFRDGERADKKLFSEQRTNVLLRSGEHYNKHRQDRLVEDLRSRGVISRKQKIRLTKNHIHRICNIYENSILETNPNTVAEPFNKDELQDVKEAEIANDIIDWVKRTNNYPERQEKFAHDFTTIGETFAIVRFDDSIGDVSETTIDEATGKPAKLGEIVIERVFGFDMKRDPNARDNTETKWWIREQMVCLEDFKAMAKEINNTGLDVDKIESSHKGTYKIFDGSTGEYREQKDQVNVRELFYKPSIRYPNGWYAMFTDDYIVYQDELPFGIYPVVMEGFDELTTSPRSSAIIRVCRPYQVEINRAASKIAEHQITLGDDKVFIQNGTKISAGGYMHGVRAFKVSGQQPIIQPGRNGAQYLDYQLAQIREMYEAANLEFVNQDKEAVGDPYQLLFRSMKEKKRFSKYVDKFGRFEKKLFSVCLDLAKKYITPEHFLKISGKSEAGNINEYLETQSNKYQIVVKPQSGDIETKFGKILGITQTLQYTGSQLGPEQIGNLIRQMPYGNDEQIFSTLTVDTDNAMNDILALDRGEYVPVNVNDNHDFLIKALQHRMKKGDFKFLDDNIQQLYREKLTQHELMLRQQINEKMAAQQGIIPTGGFLTTVNASAYNPVTKRVERIKVPSNALQWLVDRLTEQGNLQQQVESLPIDSQNRLASTPELNVPKAPQLGPQAQGV